MESFSALNDLDRLHAVEGMAEQGRQKEESYL